MKKKESPERKYLNQYLNPDGTFDEKRYLEDAGVPLDADIVLSFSW